MAVKRRALADRRRAVGRSQESLAALLGVERSTVVRWEAGETEPLPWCRPKLAEALAISLDELDELLTTLDGVPAQPSDALLLSGLGEFSAAQIGTLMERFAATDVASRREVLQELTVLSGALLTEPVRRWLARALAVIPLVAPTTVGSDDLDALERAVTLFRRWDASGMGGLHRKAVAGQLKAVTEALHETHSPAVQQRLFHITAELAQVAGWMAYDQGLPGLAQRYYLLGLCTCQESRSPVFGAKILGDMSRLSREHGHYEDSLDLIETGLYILPRQDSTLVRSELLGVESRTHANLGNQTAATRSVDACVESWHDGQGDAVPDWLHYMSQGVDGFLADTYIELSLTREKDVRVLALAEQAERHALSVRGNRPHGYDRNCILDELRLANIRLAQRDVAESVTVAQTALDLATLTSSTLVGDRLLRFHGELTTRYPDNVHVVQFSKQLRDHLKHATPHREEDIVTT